MFATTSDLIDFAKHFLKERLDSLEKDVRVCVQESCAFPALLYCFSTVDLLGALYEGDATGDIKKYGEHVGTTRKAKQYMLKMMSYKEYEIDLLQKIFRHKTVHLAQPKAAVLDTKNKRIIAWRYEDPYQGKHMTVEKLPQSAPLSILTPYTMTCDHLFTISILKFMGDISNSVYAKASGYLALLERDQKLQCKFENAIKQIYDVRH